MSDLTRERQLFETCFSEKQRIDERDKPIVFSTLPSGTYNLDLVESTWLIWQAARRDLHQEIMQLETEIASLWEIISTLRTPMSNSPSEFQ